MLRVYVSSVYSPDFPDNFILRNLVFSYAKEHDKRLFIWKKKKTNSKALLCFFLRFAFSRGPTKECSAANAKHKCRALVAKHWQGWKLGEKQCLSFLNMGFSFIRPLAQLEVRDQKVWFWFLVSFPEFLLTSVWLSQKRGKKGKRSGSVIENVICWTKNEKSCSHEHISLILEWASKHFFFHEEQGSRGNRSEICSWECLLFFVKQVIFQFICSTVIPQKIKRRPRIFVKAWQCSKISKKK